MPSRAWAIRGALTALFAGVLPGVVVHDGPIARDAPPRRFLLVGTDGGTDGTGDDLTDGTVVVQSPSPMAGGWMDEEGEIACSAWAWSGGTDFPPLRADVAALVDACETAIRADPSLGGLLAPADRQAAVGQVRIRETQTPQGALVRAVFTVAYRALIIS